MPDKKLEVNPDVMRVVDFLKKPKKEQFTDLKKKFEKEKENEEFSLKLKELKRQRREFKINKIKSILGLKR